MGKSLCHLLMKVSRVIAAKFYVANMSFNAIHENKILVKISEFTVTNRNCNALLLHLCSISVSNGNVAAVKDSRKI